MNSASICSADEESLVAGVRAADPTAYEQLLRLFGPRLLATARRMMSGNEDDARDVLQEAMLRCFKSIDTFQGGSALSTWLHRIVVTSALMKLRTRRRRHESDIEPLLPSFQADGHRVGGGKPSWADAAADLVERDEMRQVVRDCIDRLPESYRNVLLLRDIEELDTAETARLLEVNEGVVKTRLHRARQALRTLLEPHILANA
jgi:RNA polymerase sigma-70 factor (ECF subfamily)